MVTGLPIGKAAGPESVIAGCDTDTTVMFMVLLVTVAGAAQGAVLVNTQRTESPFVGV